MKATILRKTLTKKTLALLTGAAVIACVGAATIPDNPTAQDNVTAALSADPSTQAILQASDPSSAIQAYVAAHSMAPTDARIEEAFVHRMVAFGLPEMADVQSMDVVRSMPSDGEAWGVMAYMNAKRDQTAAGLGDIALAFKYASHDVFVLRTAGQLMAWYDNQNNKSAVPADTQQAVEAMRASLNQDATFTQSYARAIQEYKSLSQPNAANQTPGQANGAVADQTPQQPLPPDQGLVYTPGYDYGYSEPMYSQIAAQPYTDIYDAEPDAYWYPTPCWDTSWWWPSFGAVLVVDNNFRFLHQDNFFDHHDLSDHRFAADHFGERSNSSAVRQAAVSNPSVATPQRSPSFIGNSNAQAWTAPRISESPRPAFIPQRQDYRPTNISTPTYRPPAAAPQFRSAPSFRPAPAFRPTFGSAPRFSGGAPHGGHR